MDPFLGQIKLFGFGFAPRGWAICAGQLLPINQNQALFSLLGTTYGGDGRLNFALPDLRDRVAIGNGPGFVLGERAGEESHALLTIEIPAHSHRLAVVTSAPNSSTLVGNHLAPSTSALGFTQAASPVPGHELASDAIKSTGGGQRHSNLMPYGVLNYCIALQGVFPSRN